MFPHSFRIRFLKDTSYLKVYFSTALNWSVPKDRVMFPFDMIWISVTPLNKARLLILAKFLIILRLFAVNVIPPSIIYILFLFRFLLCLFVCFLPQLAGGTVNCITMEIIGRKMALTFTAAALLCKSGLGVMFPTVKRHVLEQYQVRV